MGEYAFSDDYGNSWSGSYSSSEEAVAAAEQEIEAGKVCSVWVAEVRPPAAPESTIDAHDLIRAVQQHNDYSKLAGRRWPPADAEQLACLTRMVKNVLQAWVYMYGLNPKHRCPVGGGATHHTVTGKG